jgi:hypothetical protein
MALIKIPQNQIVFKYTSGGEYIIENSNINYQGYYYEINGKAYTGQKFNASGSQPLTKSTPGTNTSNNIPSIIKNNLPNQLKVTSLPFAYNDHFISGPITLRYFIKKINDILIKEVNKDDYQKSQTDPLYQIVEVKFSYDMSYTYLSNLDKQMPGIKDYIENDYANNPTSGPEDG